MTDPQEEIDRILDNFKDGILGSGLTGYDIDNIESKQEAKAAIEKLILEAKLKTAVYLEEHSGDVYDLIGKLKAKLGDKE